MTNESLIALANHWIIAFNTKNLEELLSLYHDDAAHYSPKLRARQPETNGLIKGKVSMQVWWQEAFNRLPTLYYELVRLTPYQDRVFMEYIRHVANEEDLYVGEMLEVRDERIYFSMVFHR